MRKSKEKEAHKQQSAYREELKIWKSKNSASKIQAARQSQFEPTGCKQAGDEGRNEGKSEGRRQERTAGRGKWVSREDRQTERDIQIGETEREREQRWKGQRGEENGDGRQRGREIEIEGTEGRDQVFVFGVGRGMLSCCEPTPC